MTGEGGQQSMTVNLAVDIGGLHLQNPVMTASGTFGYADEYAQLMDVNRLGAIIVKGLSLAPARGNPPVRIVETACGMLNAIGLENIGLDAFVHEKLPFLRRLTTPVIVNIYGKTVAEYGELAARINDIDGIAAVEVNISCPNVRSGGLAFGADPAAAAAVVKAVRRRISRPLMVKLSPNVTDITAIAGAVEDAGADIISLINTISGMAVDLKSRRPKLANVLGGLSGPAIKPVALLMVWRVAKCVHIPVVGVGGIMTAADVLEFLLVGAAAVQVGTASFINPRAAVDIIDGLEKGLKEMGAADVREIVGGLRVP